MQSHQLIYLLPPISWRDWLHVCGNGKERGCFKPKFWDCLWYTVILRRKCSAVVLTYEFAQGLSLSILKTQDRYLNNIKSRINFFFTYFFFTTAGLKICNILWLTINVSHLIIAILIANKIACRWKLVIYFYIMCFVLETG